MKKRLSAGLLMYRLKNGKLELLLAHPGGPFFQSKDEGHWSIPKGEPDETEDLLNTAIREFKEETGIAPPEERSEYIPLGSVIQKGGKEVYGWAFQGEFIKNPGFRSNEFEIEWPPRSGKRMKFPEIDKVESFPFEEALKKIKESQKEFINRLKEYLEKK